jgi:hypothetical protein
MGMFGAVALVIAVLVWGVISANAIDDVRHIIALNDGYLPRWTENVLATNAFINVLGPWLVAYFWNRRA